MKKKYTIAGDIEINYTDFIALLKFFLDPSKVRDRYASDIEKVIHYKDNNVDIYINEYGEKNFLFSAEYIGSFNDVNDFIDKLISQLNDNNITYYQFDWSEIDDDGNDIGEDYEIKSWN